MLLLNLGVSVGEQNIVRVRRRDLRVAAWAAIAIWALAGAILVGPSDPARAADLASGSLAGTVRATDGRVEVGKATVTLSALSAESPRDVASVSVDDHGHWSLDDVAPGRYTLRIESYMPDRGYTWWGDQPLADLAHEFEVTAGQHRTGMDVTVKPSMPAGEHPAIVGSRTDDPDNVYVAQEATVLTSGWPAGAELQYRWLSEGDPLSPGYFNGAYAWLYTSLYDTDLTAEITVTHRDYATAIHESAPKRVRAGQQQVTTPYVAGRAVVGSRVTVDIGQNWTGDTTYTYAWYATSKKGRIDYADTGDTFVIPGSAHGRTIHVLVTGEVPGYETAQVVGTLRGTVDPANMIWTKPTISGTPKVGEILTIEPGEWTAGAKLTYSWEVGGTPLKTTSRRLRITQTMAGEYVVGEVTATLEGYRTQTAWRIIQIDLLPITSATPTIRGDLRVGGVVEVRPGTWTRGTSFGYQWYVDGKPVSGHNGPAWRLPPSALGRKLTVSVFGYLPNHTSATHISKAHRVAVGVMSTKEPRVAGGLYPGGKATAEVGRWTKGATFAYQWYASGKAIRGATKKTYTVPSSMAGKSLRVKVTGSAQGYTRVTRTSAPSGRVPRIAKPRIIGKARAGYTLRADPGRWTAGTRFTYEWRNERGGLLFPDPKRSHELLVEDWMAGMRIQLTVIGKKKGYATARTRSTFTGAVPR